MLAFNVALGRSGGGAALGKRERERASEQEAGTRGEREWESFQAETWPALPSSRTGEMPLRCVVGSGSNIGSHLQEDTSLCSEAGSPTSLDRPCSAGRSQNVALLFVHRPGSVRLAAACAANVRSVAVEQDGTGENYSRSVRSSNAK